MLYISYVYYLTLNCKGIMCFISIITPFYTVAINMTATLWWNYFT